MTETEALEKIKAVKSAARKASARSKPQAYSLAEDDADALKLLAYGHTGSGKTYLLIGPLLCGERLLVVSTDFGSNGLQTIKNELRRRDAVDRLQNLRALDLATYEDVLGFWEAPLDFFPGLAEFNPTVVVWEGFSAFNIDLLDEYILSMAPGAENAGALRYAGFTHTKQDWQGMKRGTIRALRKFLAFQNPTHKILTCLEAQPETDDLTNKVQRSVLVHGTGRSLIGPAFDAIIECYKEEKDGQTNFFYRCEGSSDKYLVKNRGFHLQAKEEANPERLWRILTTQESTT